MKNILIIGCGLLGSSLLRRIHKKKIANKIFIYEKSSSNVSKIKKLKHTIKLAEVKKLYPKDHKCPVFKTPLIFGGGLNQFSPSLDRIDNKKGYVKNNVQWISAKANTIKRDATADELYALAKYLKKQTKRNK